MKSINNAMKRAHSLMSSAGDFTAQQGHLLIQKATGVDSDTSGKIFAIMQIMGYIVESPHGGFRAAGGQTCN